MRQRSRRPRRLGVRARGRRPGGRPASRRRQLPTDPRHALGATGRGGRALRRGHPRTRLALAPDPARRSAPGTAPSDAYALVTVGYFGNTVLPARGGELLRTVLLVRSGRRPARREILGSIASERMLDAVSLALLFAVLTFAGDRRRADGPAPCARSPLAVMAGGAAVALGLSARPAQRAARDAFAARVRPLVRASRPLLGPTGAAAGAACRSLVWGIEATIFWLVAQSLGARPEPGRRRLPGRAERVLRAHPRRAGLRRHVRRRRRVRPQGARTSPAARP